MNLVRRPATGGYMAVCYDHHGVLAWTARSRSADEIARDHAAREHCHTGVARPGVEYFQPADWPDETPNAKGRST